MASPIVNRLGKVAAEVAMESKDWWAGSGRLFGKSGGAILDSMGEFGKVLKDRLNNYVDQHGIRTGQIMSDYEKTMRPVMENPQKLAQWHDDLRRVKPATDPDVVNQVTFDRMLNNDIYVRAQKAGIKVGPRVNDDWHMMYNQDLFKGTKLDKMRDHLIQTGQASSYREADRIIDHLRTVNKGGTVHTLESPRRINLPGYRRDASVMLDHYSNSERRILQAEMFGPKDEKLNGILDGIKAESGEAAYKHAKLIAEMTLGRGGAHSPTGILDNLIGSNTYKKLASIEAATKLGLSVIKQTGQVLNTAVFSADKGGIAPLAKAIRDAMVDHGNFADFGVRSGATIVDTLRDFRALAMKETEGIGSKVLRYTQFENLDKYLRIFSANTGKHMAIQAADDLMNPGRAKKAALILEQLGLDPQQIAQKGLQEGDLLLAGKRVSDATQFRTTALDLPPAWRSSPTMKALTLYKSFAFAQSKFVKDFVIKPAMRGEMKPLVYMMTLFPIFGEVIGDIDQLVKKGHLKDRPKEVIERAIDNFTYVGSLGIMADITYSAASPMHDALWRFLAGPIFSDVVEVSQMPFHQHPVADMEKKLLRSVPVAGPMATEKIFDRKQTQKTMDWKQKGAITNKLRKLKRSITSTEQLPPTGKGYTLK